MRPNEIAALLAMLCAFALAGLFAHEHEARLDAEAALALRL